MTDWIYLGPSSWNQSILRLLPFSKKFNKAAKRHDISYALGGNEEEKTYADEMFVQDMKKVSGYNLFAWFFCYSYYLLVKYLGFMFFYYTESKGL